MPVQNPEFSGSTTDEQPAVTDFVSAVVNAQDGIVNQTGKITKAALAAALKPLIMSLTDETLLELIEEAQGVAGLVSRAEAAAVRSESAARSTINFELTNGLDLNFIDNNYRFRSHTEKVDGASAEDIVNVVTGITFTRAADGKTRVSESGAIEDVGANVMARTHDIGTGANPRCVIEGASENLIKNPDWTGVVDGLATSNVAFASNGVRYVESSGLDTVTVASGFDADLGMNYVDLTIVATAGVTAGGVFQLFMSQFTGADEIPVLPSTDYVVWCYVKYISGGQHVNNMVWRVQERTISDVPVTTFTSGFNAFFDGTDGLLLQLHSSGPTPWTTQSTTEKVQPFIQIGSITEGETVVLRFYEFQLELGHTPTSLIRRNGSWPWQRNADVLTINTANLPAGAWTEGGSSIVAEISRPHDTGALLVDASTVPDTYMQKVGAFVGRTSDGVDSIDASPGYGSLNDKTPKQWVWSQSDLDEVRFSVANGPTEVGSVVVGDQSEITLETSGGEIRLGRLMLLPYALTVEEATLPIDQANTVVGVMVESEDLYVVKELTGKELLVSGALYPFYTAWLTDDGEIRATRASRFLTPNDGDPVETVAISDDGKVIVPLTPNVFHGLLSIMSQSFEYITGSYQVITREPPNGGRLFMPIMDDGTAHVQYGTARSGTFTVVDPADIQGVAELSEMIPDSLAGSNTGETPSAVMGSTLMGFLRPVDNDQGPKFLFMNLAFNGTTVAEHGRDPTPLFDPLASPPEGPYYEMAGVIPVHKSQLEALDKKFVVPAIFGEIGWSDQFEAAGFFSRFVQTQTEINDRLVGGSLYTPLLEQEAPPVYLMGQICTREFDEEEVELDMVTLQTNGYIKIVGNHYSLWPLGFHTDVLHWTATGVERWGVYRARALAREVYGQGWWPTMPSVHLPAAIRPAGSVRVVGSTIEVDFTCDGDALALYDATMGNPAQGGMRYTRDVGGNLAITGYSVSGKTLTVTFGSAPTAGWLGFADAGIPQDLATPYDYDDVPRTVIGDDQDPPNYCIACRVRVDP